MLAAIFFSGTAFFHPLGSPEPVLVRVPSLRNVATTAPYFHDGSASTLSEAVKSMGIAQLDRGVLTDQQISAIVCFPQHAHRHLSGRGGQAGCR